MADLQQIAQEKRPDLKRLTLAARSAQEEVTKARLNYLPRLHVVAEYDVDQRRLFGPNGDSYTVMALLNFNLFNGLADLAKVKESRAQEAQARDLKQEMEDRVRHQVTEMILNLKTARERLQVAQGAVAQAREGLRLIRLRYETGLTILVDLLTAEDALKNAELSQVGALLDTHLAQAGLELALGTISGPVAEAEKNVGAPVCGASVAARRSAPTTGTGWKPMLQRNNMIAPKKILGLSALVVVALLFMAWLAGLLHFGKIAPGLAVPQPAAPAGRVLVVSETPIPRELEVLGEVISKSLAQVSAQVPGRVS